MIKRSLFGSLSALAVVTDLVVAHHSSQPGPFRKRLKIPKVHCVFSHPTCSLKFPYASSQRVTNSGKHGYRARLEYYGFCCTLQRKTLSALKDKAMTYLVILDERPFEVNLPNALNHLEFYMIYITYFTFRLLILIMKHTIGQRVKNGL